MLHLSITMEKGDFPYHVRYPAKMAFIEFKVKLEMVVGIYAQDMKLELHSPNDKFCSELVGDDRTLEEVGKRCVIRTSGQKPRFATLAYIGPTHFGEKQEAIRPNIWVGVIYEKPEGKNDGSLDGKRYFTCKPNFGGFVLPTSVEVLEEDGHFVNDSENQKDNEQIEEI
uniref:CAP-Gly domain-containing protein n=1 Tax=Meloidogyne hapla TaxID=6305 RepID=A0A1I8B7I6_MELHA